MELQDNKRKRQNSQEFPRKKKQDKANTSRKRKRTQRHPGHPTNQDSRHGAGDGGPEGSYDHNPILLTLGTLDTITCRNTDCEQYRMLLQRDATNIPRLETTAGIDDAVWTLVQDIRQALVSSTKVTTKPYYVSGIPEETKQLIRDRRRAKRTAMRTEASADKNRLNQLNRRVKAALDDHGANKWQEHLERITPEDRSMWKTCRALPQKRKPFPAIHGSNGIVYEKRDKAEAFVDTLERQFQENYIDNAWENIVNGRARRINTLSDDKPIRHATSEVLQEILRHLNIRKAPGWDEIGNIEFRKLPRRGIAALLNIVNAILRLRHFPAD